MEHEIMQQAAEARKVLPGEVNLSRQQHENISSKLGESWNKSLTSDNYEISNNKPADWANPGLLCAEPVKQSIISIRCDFCCE